MSWGKRKKTGKHLGRGRLTALYVVLVLGSVMMLLPFVWMVSTSFKVENDIFSIPIKWLPQK